MALYAFDGTWNSAKDDEDHAYRNTNVVRFFRAYAGSDTNFYVAGVGTRLETIGRIFGGAFGLGARTRLDEAYAHLCARWDAGDTVIDVIGFSRGAAIALDFCNLVQRRGIRALGSDDVVEAEPTIRFLGLWDVVAAFGLANLGLRDLNFGHHLFLPRKNVRYAFHALALDEQRSSFLPTRLDGAYEVWFRGVHSDVGGGNGNKGLNDITLAWMFAKAMAAKLPIDAGAIAALAPEPDTPARLSARIALDLRLITAVDRYHHSVSPVAGCRMPPATCIVESPNDERAALEVGQQGLEILPAKFADRFVVLVSVMDAEAKALDFPLAGVREALLSLVENRIRLVTNDAELLEARTNAIRLTRAIIGRAKHHGYHALNEFFLTEALFQLRPLFPFTDD